MKIYRNFTDHKRNVHRAIDEEHARDTFRRIGRPKTNTEGYRQRRPDNTSGNPQVPVDLPVRRRVDHRKGQLRI